MNGTAHMTVGAVIGFMAANAVQSSPAETLVLVGIGTASALLPDADIDGKLSNKITISHKAIRSIAQTIGLLMCLYSFLEGGDQERWLGMGAGAAIVILASFITKRRMLTVTGIGIAAGGLSLQESWLLLLGIYIIAASFVSHRTYTHSAAGLIFFGMIAYQLDSSLGIEGVFKTCMAAYASHLITDMKFLPFNRRGIKLLLPFSSKEI